MGFMRTGGTVFWGFISDRIGRDRTYGISVLIALLGIVCLMAITPGSPAWLLYGFVILYGVGHSAGNPTYGALIGDIFAGRKVGTIFGLLEITFGLGSAFGSWFGGYVFDLTGSYRWAFALCLVTFALSHLAVYVSLVWWKKESGPARPEPR
jgi:MFS family permease